MLMLGRTNTHAHSQVRAIIQAPRRHTAHDAVGAARRRQSCRRKSRVEPRRPAGPAQRQASSTGRSQVGTAQPAAPAAAAARLQDLCTTINNHESRTAQTPLTPARPRWRLAAAPCGRAYSWCRSRGASPQRGARRPTPRVGARSASSWRAPSTRPSRAPEVAPQVPF